MYNPYTPGAGFMPAYLAGREDLLHEANGYLESVQHRYPQRSVVYYGLRGVGKTVLLNRIEEYADDMDILHRHIEADEKHSFTASLIVSLRRIMNEISLSERAKTAAEKMKLFFCSLAVTYHVEEKSFELSAGSVPNIATGILSEDLTELFVQLGRLANKTGNTISLFIDEVQYLNKEELSSLAAAIHRCNQLRLPVILFCAGLPNTLKLFGEARSYSERLFVFEKIDSLSDEYAAHAITEPAKSQNVTYTDGAVQAIVQLTNGYPYFIQAACSAVWGIFTAYTITEQNVKQAANALWADLDRGFFSVRYDRCSRGDKLFMIAMVKCGTLPCTISDVAAILQKSVQSISPVRGRLISKGMIYAAAHAEIDFTVPQFDTFIKRINPTLRLDI